MLTLSVCDGLADELAYLGWSWIRPALCQVQAIGQAFFRTLSSMNVLFFVSLRQWIFSWSREILSRQIGLRIRVLVLFPKY